MDWDEIGEGDHPAQNPPLLDDHDLFVFDWYGENCTAIVKEYGLMPSLIAELDLAGDKKTIFLNKLNMIYMSLQRIRQKEQAAKQNA